MNAMARLAAVENAAAKRRWGDYSAKAPHGAPSRAWAARPGLSRKTLAQRASDADQIRTIIASHLHAQGVLYGDAMSGQRVLAKHRAAVFGAYRVAHAAGYSLAEIGGAVSRHHSTIHHAVKEPEQ